MLSQFIQTKFATVVVNTTALATLLSILHLLPIICGAIASVIWLIIMVYKLRQQITDTEKSKLDLYLEVHQKQICLRENCPNRILEKK